MAERYDQAFKLTAEAEARGLLEFFAGVTLDRDAEIEDLDRELTLGTRRVDHLYRIHTTQPPSLIHLEAFKEFPSDWSVRHMRYACLIWAKYELPLHTFTFLLTPKGLPSNFAGEIRIDAGSLQLHHRPVVVRMWEVPARRVIESNNPVLCAWVPLTDATRAERQEAYQMVVAGQDPDLVTRMRLLAGLRYLESEVAEMFSEELVKESSVYKSWKAKFTEEGREEGRLDGERRLLRRQLEGRFHTVPQWAESRLQEASQDSLERWAIQVLTADSIEDALR